VRFEARAEPPTIGHVIVYHELGVVICEQIVAVDRSYGPPITTVLARPAERSTWRAVVEELQTRERDGTFALDWIEPRYVEYLIAQATSLRAGQGLTLRGPREESGASLLGVPRSANVRQLQRRSTYRARQSPSVDGEPDLSSFDSVKVNEHAGHVSDRQRDRRAAQAASPDDPQLDRPEQTASRPGCCRPR
jgi:hypothetical protein